MNKRTAQITLIGDILDIFENRIDYAENVTEDIAFTLYSNDVRTIEAAVTLCVQGRVGYPAYLDRFIALLTHAQVEYASPEAGKLANRVVRKAQTLRKRFQ